MAAKTKRAVLGIVLACVATALALTLYWRGGGGGQKQALASYVDERTLEERMLPASEIPPAIAADGQRTMALAIYGSCDEGKSRTLLYLLKYSDATRAAMQALSEGKASTDGALSESALVRSPKGDTWEPLNSRAGEKIAGNNPCGEGQKLTPVKP